MSKDAKRKLDVLHPELSKQLAWSVSLVPDAPAAPTDAPTDAPVESATPDPKAAAHEAKQRAELCRVFANDILKVWEWPLSVQQKRATRALLRTARDFGFDIARMVNHPLAAIRLLRLAARYAGELKIGTMTALALSWISLPVGHPELADFIVEVAQCGHHPLLFTLDMAFSREKIEGKHPTLGKRLVDLYKTTNDKHIRSTALRLLSIDDFPETIPTLQEALRLPNATMRYYALAILVQMKGTPLRVEDMQWLLDDAVIHPLSRGDSSRGLERIYNYEDALTSALEKCPPPDGWKTLDTIADHRGVHIRKDRRGLSADWALTALAAAYPERAITRIDHNFACPEYTSHFRLVETIAKLPDELARPRLIRMTGSANVDAVQFAIKTWFERFGQECPVDPLAGIPKEMLAAPPSERMLANLTALRSKSKEVRNAMIDVLLQDLPETETPQATLESHQRESLALLMFLFRTRGNAYDHPTLGRLWLSDLAKFFLKRGGKIAFDTLARWADEGIRAGVRGGWLDALAGLTREGLLDAEQIDRLRDMARYGLEHPCLHGAATSLSAFDKLGAPNELALLLLNEIVHPDPAIRWSWYPMDAVGALSKMGPCPELDEAITREIENACRGPQWRRSRWLVSLVEKRNVPKAMEIMMDRIMSYRGERDSAAAVGDAFQVLRKVKRIDDEMVAGILADRHHPLFPMAASGISKNSPPAFIEALMRVLDSPGAAAGEAAEALLRASVLPLDDERIDRILQASPVDLKARICDTLILDKVPVTRLYEHLKACLLSDDEAISVEVVERLHRCEPSITNELFKEVLPNVPVRTTRARIRRRLELPDEVEEYWEDENDVGDDDEETDLDDEDDIDEDDMMDDEGFLGDA